MSAESLRAAMGRRLVSAGTAEDLGTLDHVHVDADRTIRALVVGSGKKARLVEWAHISGFGPDAVMVGADGALRDPVSDEERRAADGAFDLLTRRVLTVEGNEVGTIDDVAFDTETGALGALQIGERTVEPQRLRGVGSYAAVVDLQDEAAR